jgi:hypothetical protein
MSETANLALHGIWSPSLLCDLKFKKILYDNDNEFAGVDLCTVRAGSPKTKSFYKIQA